MRRALLAAFARGEHVGIDTEWDYRAERGGSGGESGASGGQSGADCSWRGSDELEVATVQLAVGDEHTFVVEAKRSHCSAQYDEELVELLRWLLLGDLAAAVREGETPAAADARATTPASLTASPSGGATRPASKLLGFAFAGDAIQLARRIQPSRHASSAAEDRVPTDWPGSKSHFATSPTLTSAVRADAAAIRARVVDVQRLAIERGVGSSARVPSLGASCAVLLGRAIDKDEQCSDWAARPLRESQLEYAALDALACVRLEQSHEHAPCDSVSRD